MKLLAWLSHLFTPESDETSMLCLTCRLWSAGSPPCDRGEGCPFATPNGRVGA